MCNKVSVLGHAANFSLSSIISTKNVGLSPTPVSSSLILNPSCSIYSSMVSVLIGDYFIKGNHSLYRTKMRKFNGTQNLFISQNIKYAIMSGFCKSGHILVRMT